MFVVHCVKMCVFKRRFIYYVCFDVNVAHTLSLIYAPSVILKSVMRKENYKIFGSFLDCKVFLLLRRAIAIRLHIFIIFHKRASSRPHHTVEHRLIQHPTTHAYAIKSYLWITRKEPTHHQSHRAYFVVTKIFFSTANNNKCY